MRKKCLENVGISFKRKCGVTSIVEEWNKKFFTLINEEENVNAAVKTALSCTLAEQAAVLKT